MSQAICFCPVCGKQIDEKCAAEDSTPAKEKAADVNSGKKVREKGSILGIFGTVLMIGGAVVAAPCLLATLAGFGAAGIVAGSTAAATQASIGSVAAGSAFATLQSLGATGALVTGATAGTVAAGAGAVTAISSGQNGNGDNCHDRTGKVEPLPVEEKDEDENGRWITCNHCGHRFFHREE